MRNGVGCVTFLQCTKLGRMVNLKFIDPLDFRIVCEIENEHRRVSQGCEKCLGEFFFHSFFSAKNL